MSKREPSASVLRSVRLINVTRIPIGNVTEKVCKAPCLARAIDPESSPKMEERRTAARKEDCNDSVTGACTGRR